MREQELFDDTESTLQQTCEHCVRKLISTESKETGVCVACRKNNDNTTDWRAGVLEDAHINNNLSYGDNNFGYHFNL